MYGHMNIKQYHIKKKSDTNIKGIRTPNKKMPYNINEKRRNTHYHSVGE